MFSYYNINVVGHIRYNFVKADDIFVFKLTREVVRTQWIQIRLERTEECESLCMLVSRAQGV